jgi:hypothetical protein
MEKPHLRNYTYLMRIFITRYIEDKSEKLKMNFIEKRMRIKIMLIVMSNALLTIILDKKRSFLSFSVLIFR